MAALRAVICGSPQPGGKCATAATHVAKLLAERFPEDDVRAFAVSQGWGRPHAQDPMRDAGPVMAAERVRQAPSQVEACRVFAEDAVQPPLPRLAGARVRDVAVQRLDVHPCVGCNRCADGGGCFMRDDMDVLIEAVEEAGELYVVCPVYFAGPPAQMKALLDRLQPLFFTDVRIRPKRPARLLVIGGGGDPHGFDPLVTIVRSSLAVAGFQLEAVEASIGEPPEGVLEHAERLLCTVSGRSRAVERRWKELS